MAHDPCPAVTIEWMLTCQTARPRNDERIDLLGVSDGIVTSRFPLRIEELYLVAAIDGPPTTSVLLRLFLERGEIKREIGNGYDVAFLEHGHATVCIPIGGWFVTDAGDYRFVLMDGAREVGHVRYSVTLTTEPTVQH